MAKTSISVQLEIYGDSFDLQSISTRLNITPTKQWKKGDCVETSIVENEYIAVDHSVTLTRKATVWRLETGHEESYKISTQARKLLDIVAEKTDELCRIQTEESVEIRISFVIYVYDNITPALIIDKELVAFAHAINAHIDIDQYFY